MQRFTDGEVKAIVRGKLKSDNFKVLAHETFTPSGNTFGFLSNNCGLKVSIEHKNQEKEFRFFVKRSAVKNDYHKELIEKLGATVKEEKCYKTILQNLKPYINGKIYPDCYLATETTLVLDDLSELGYTSKNVNDFYDIDHICLSLGQLAKFHAGAISWELKENKRIDEEYPVTVKEAVFVNSQTHPGYKHLQVTIKIIQEICNLYFPQVNPTTVKKGLQILQDLPTLMKPSTKHRNALAHGDLWANNIMFSYDCDKQLSDALIIDFQLVRYTPPALDVLLLIFLTTSHALREKKDEGLQHLLIHYYNCFSNAISGNNMKIQEVLTWEEFKMSCQDALSGALGVAVVYLHYITVPAEVVLPKVSSSEKYREYVEVNRIDTVLSQMRTDEKYRKRLMQALSDLLSHVKGDLSIL